MKTKHLTRHGVRSFTGRRTASTVSVEMLLGDGATRPLPLNPSLAIAYHSPTGFEWGYGGSGPSQLALAILLLYFGDAGQASRFYGRFKDSVIAKLPKEGWTIEIADIDEWIRLGAEGRDGQSVVRKIEKTKPAKPRSIFLDDPDVPLPVSVLDKVGVSGKKLLYPDKVVDWRVGIWEKLAITIGDNFSAIDPDLQKVNQQRRTQAAEERGFYHLASPISRHNEAGQWVTAWIKPTPAVRDFVRDRCCEGRIGGFELIPWSWTRLVLFKAIDALCIASPWICFVDLDLAYLASEASTGEEVQQ